VAKCPFHPLLRFWWIATLCNFRIPHVMVVGLLEVYHADKYGTLRRWGMGECMGKGSWVPRGAYGGDSGGKWRELVRNGTLREGRN
jgi:hypothetical protein